MFHVCEKYDSDNNTFVNIANIKSVRYRNQSGKDGVFEFGNAFASSIEVTYYIDSQADLNVGDIIRYSHSLDVDLQTFEVVPQWKHYINFFFVDSFEKNGNVAHFIAYDAIKKFDVDYSQRMLSLKASFPMTCGAIVNDISSFVGYPIIVDGWNPSVRDALVNYFYADGITARTILSQIFEIQGKNFCAQFASSSNVSSIQLYVSNYKMETGAAVRPGSKATGYYVIAPTDQETYIADGKTLIPLFYKKGGLEVNSDVADPIDCVKLVKYDGTVAASYGATENNVYTIRNNIIVENTNSPISVLGLYNIINSINGAPKMKAKLFPFRCAFSRASIMGITYFVDFDGTIKQIPIMDIDWRDDGVTIESYGVSTYQYSDYETQNIENQNQITASIINNLSNVVSDISVIVGDGVLDPDFTAQDITGAVNELLTDNQNTEAKLDARTGAILLPTGTTADRRAEIVDKLSTYGYCEFLAGTYYVSAEIELTSGQTVKGCGKNSILKKIGTTTDAFFSVLNDAQNVTIKDLSFHTGGAIPVATPSTENTGNGEIGIYVENRSGRVTVDNCYFLGLTRAGILCASGLNWLTSVNVTNCSFLYCNYGIKLDVNGEFANVTNCNFNNNFYGALVVGGNNKFADCGFDANAVGFVLYDSSGVPTNDGHGSAVGCTFNHNTRNAIEISNIDNGYLFSSCCMFFGDIGIANSRGIQFDDCLIMGNKTVSDHTNFNINNCPGLIAITNCCCPNTNGFTITKTNSDYVFSKNNKTRDGAITAALDRYCQYGQVTGDSTSPGGQTNKTVTFSPAFPSAPHVQVTPCTDMSGTSQETGKLNFMIGNISATGFTIRTYNNSASLARTGVYNWYAFVQE